MNLALGQWVHRLLIQAWAATIACTWGKMQCFPSVYNGQIWLNSSHPLERTPLEILLFSLAFVAAYTKYRAAICNLYMSFHKLWDITGININLVKDGLVETSIFSLQLMDFLIELGLYMSGLALQSLQSIYSPLHCFRQGIDIRYPAENLVCYLLYCRCLDLPSVGNHVTAKNMQSYAG